MTKSGFGVFVLATILGADGLQAALITSESSIPVPFMRVGFEAFAGGASQRVTSPTQLAPGIVLTTTNPSGSYVGSGPYSFTDNGVWDDTITLAGLEVDSVGNDAYTMTILFSSPVSSVTGRMNYSVFRDSGFRDPIITALGTGNIVLESYNLAQLAPISTPGSLNTGALRGIARTTSDIYGVSFSNSAIAVSQLLVTPVPEPTMMTLTLSALLFVGLAGRRRRF